MPSTYTPNLGFEKVEPGEQTGTWGGTLNTNFDLIGEAITGLGTDAITFASGGSASGTPHTVVITDGATSVGRNAFVEFTDGGDMTDTGYVQYGPSDSEKLMWVKNSTGFSLVFFQGTYDAGRAVTIANGDTALLRFTGAGAASSYAYLVMSNVVLDGVTLPNSVPLKWNNAAGDDTIDVIVDASDDIVVTVNSTDILQYDLSATTFNFKDNDLLTTGDLSVGSIVATGSISGSNLSGTNTGDELVFTGTSEGLVPTSPGGTTLYLRADGSWVAPPGDGFASPLTTKGDIFTYDTGDARLGVGTNGQVLTANSATATGLQWTTISTGGLGSVVEDTSPELGGDLDSNNFDIEMRNTGTRTQIRFYESSGNGTSYMALQAANSMTASYTLSLPTTDGVNGEYLKTDGSGNLSWGTPSGGTYGVAAIYMNGVTETLHPDATASTIRSLIGAGTGNGDITSVEIIAGEGLTGGGLDTSGSVSLTVNLGTPSTLSGTTTNATTASGHTHEVTFDRIQTSLTNDTQLYPLLVDDNFAGERIPYVDSAFTFNAVDGTFTATNVTVTGAVTAGSNGISTTGTVSGAVLNATSGRKLKDLIVREIETGGLKKLKPIMYTLKTDAEKIHRMGYFADDMAEVYPEIVTFDENGEAAGIDYSRLVVPLIKKVLMLEERLQAVEAL